MSEATTGFEDFYPLLLPHVTIANGKLWLGQAEICTLTPEEEGYCLLCDGTRRFSEILELVKPLPPASRVAAFIVPIPCSFNKNESKSKRVLVISPTPQTGYMAAGGTMAKWTDAEVLHVICFSQTKDSVLPEIFNSVAGISAIRRDESEICATVCGCTNQFLDYPDYTVRKIDWPSPAYPADLAAALQASLYRIIHEYDPSIILAPAAIGDHPDHSMVNRIIIDFFKQDFFKNTRFFLYQDFPYAVKYNMIDDFLWRTENCFVKLKDHFEDVTGQMAVKEVLYTIYFSAMDLPARSLVNHILQRNILACPGQQQKSGGLEHFYELVTFN